MVTTSSDARRQTAPSSLACVWAAALVFLSACAGLELSDVIGRVSALWIANAILVYFLLRNPRENWVSILAAGLAGNFLADLVMGDGLMTAAVLTLCNAVGILIVAAPMSYLGLENEFSRPKPLCVFYALAAGPAPAASALISAVFFHYVHGRAFLEQALDWYATDALGYSIVVPMLMTVKLRDLRKMFSRAEVLMTLALLGTVAVTLVLNFYLRSLPIAFLIFPAVLLVTFQRGFAGGSIGLLMAAAYLMTPALFGHGHFAVKLHTLREQIIIVQLFIAVIGLSVVLVGAALEERRKLEQGLAAAIVRAENSREEAVVARDIAERANRLKSMFLATMSHELRTPLNAIIGFSDLMKRQLYGPIGDARYREYSELIQGAGHHLLSLINDVLDMSKIEAGKFELHREPFDIREIVRDGITLMRDRADQASVSMQQELPEAPVFVEADRRATKQILLNLLSNAIKFTPAGGHVTVGVTTDGANIILSVADTGIGIPSDQVTHLGNPFVQVRNSAGSSHEGTGLGLALVRALAEVHDGQLKIESQLHRGTTVSVIIPGAMDDADAVAPAMARAGI